jgi:REP element-mobilizing transposase RayT
LYQSINDARLKVNEWIDYNIDAVTIKKEDVHIVANAFDNMQLFYKIKKCIKTGDFEYVNDKGVIRKF